MALSSAAAVPPAVGQNADESVVIVEVRRVGGAVLTRLRCPLTEPIASLKRKVTTVLDRCADDGLERHAVKLLASMTVLEDHRTVGDYWHYSSEIPLGITALVGHNLELSVNTPAGVLSVSVPGETLVAELREQVLDEMALNRSDASLKKDGVLLDLQLSLEDCAVQSGDMLYLR
mmetsp:Transcript_125458/g.250374  ORF Transcript_125458/g.250374 Transcript_125458/m.250374 type:complete len:175 (+) Transcript_125458:54-578(+)